MNNLLAIDQPTAEWMSSNGQAGTAAAEETISRRGETRELGDGLGPEPQVDPAKSWS
jgi:hypothetical protein